MSPKGKRAGQHVERIAGSLRIVRGDHPAAAPPEPEYRAAPSHSPAVVITQAMIDEWLANDPEMEQMRFEQRHGVLY